MIRRIFWNAAIFGLLASTAFGQDIVISGPSQIDVGKPYWYDVTGLTEPQLKTAKLEYHPKDGIQLRALKTWGGDALLFLQAENECTLTISINLNAWRKTLQKSIEEAVAADVDEALVIDLRLIDSESEDKYPTASGSIIVKVGQGGDDDDDDGPPPPPPPGTKWSIVIFRETGNQGLTLSQLEITSSSLFQEELAEAGYKFRQYDPDAAKNLPEEWIGFWKAVEGKPLPQVAVAPIEGGKVWTFPLPKDKTEFLEIVKGGPK